MSALHAVWNLRNANLKLLNIATLVLLPKKEDVTTPKDFRPISLVHFFVKLIMKILATRLRPRMADLVKPYQNAFINGRTIHDNFAYVRGMAKSFSQSKTPAIMIKLDIAKAFDTVSWEFLLQVMAAKGFGMKWRDWISAMLCSSSTRILVNGCMTDEIYHARGLRQGAPLSPLLFTLVMDCLTALISFAEGAGLLRPIGTIDMPFRASIYADDVVIFLNPCQ